MQEYSLYFLEDGFLMTLVPTVSVMGRVMYLHISVQTRADGCEYENTDRCSLPYAMHWFASIDRHACTDTGAWTRTGVAWPLALSKYVYPPQRLLNNNLINYRQTHLHISKPLDYLNQWRSFSHGWENRGSK